MSQTKSVEGLATARPWKQSCFLVQGPKGDWVAHTGMGNLQPSRSRESEANAELIVTAVNAYDSNKARIEELKREIDLSLAIMNAVESYADMFPQDLAIALRRQRGRNRAALIEPPTKAES